MNGSLRNAGIALALILLPLSHIAVADTDINETRAVNADATVQISNVEGSIDVSAWENNEVHISGSLGKGVEGLDISGDASRLKIEVQYPDDDSWHGRKIHDTDLIVRVPVGVRLIATGVSADITINGVEGPVRAETVSGEIEIGGSPAELNINSVSGDTVADVDTQKIKYSSVSGDLQLRGLTGEFSGNAVSGDIEVMADHVTAFSAETVSGSVELSGTLDKNATLDIKTLSGDIVLYLPADLSADISFDTFSGDLYGDFDIPRAKDQDYVKFSVGNGDAQIRLNTFSGSAELNRAR
ncbi:MAG: hypothetical protein E2O56_04045 [Gammaproteobacteria bacterium]|nr:MAG: hypothetical protein E2O56_04045 [Gammaproteobacteria bacterium]